MLPSPRIGMEEQPSSKDEEVVEDGGGDQEAPAGDDEMNWSKIYEGVLLTRISEEGRGSSSSPRLHGAPSTPVPSSPTMGTDCRDRGQETAAAAGAFTRFTPSLSKLRHSRSTLDSHCCSHTPTKVRSSYAAMRRRSNRSWMIVRSSSPALSSGACVPRADVLVL